MSTAAEPNIVASDGVIVRVVSDALGYVTAPDEQRTLAFVPEAIAGYAGEPLHELGITEGREVKVWWQPESGTVTRVEIVSLKHVRPEHKSAGAGQHDQIEAQESVTASEPLPVVRQQPSPSTSQFELHPDRKAASSGAARRALPRGTRTFGKLVDTSNLRPGDLLLSREQEPDRISQLIAEVQAEGGYATQDGRWTHAAMYVGDDQSVIEATFDGLASGGDVRLTSLDEYCDGKNILRFRRSKYLNRRHRLAPLCACDESIDAAIQLRIDCSNLVQRCRYGSRGSIAARDSIPPLRRSYARPYMRMRITRPCGVVWEK